MTAAADSASWEDETQPRVPWAVVYPWGCMQACWSQGRELRLSTLLDRQPFDVVKCRPLFRGEQSLLQLKRH